MRRTTRSSLIVLILVLGRPSFVEACPNVGYRLPRAVQCTDSVNLSVAVDKVALYPKDRERAEAFERYLQAKAIQILGENRIAVDPKGQDLHFEILETPDGGVLIAISSRGSESTGLVLDAAEVENLPNVATENVSEGTWRTPNLLAQIALDLFSRTIANNWQSDCDPRRILSANGRYAFEVPPSHRGARERYLSALAENGWIEPLTSLPVGSLFALWEDGEEERLSIVRLEENESPEKFSVTDDGLLIATTVDP